MVVIAGFVVIGRNKTFVDSYISFLSKNDSNEKQKRITYPPLFIEVVSVDFFSMINDVRFHYYSLYLHLFYFPLSRY